MFHMKHIDPYSRIRFAPVDGAGSGDATGGDGAGGGSPPAAGADQGGGAGGASWMDGLDDGVREGLAPKAYESANALGKAYLELDALVGKKGVIPLGADASDEEVANWDGWKVLGRPDDASAYQFAMPEGREAGEADTAFQGAMGTVFHAAGLNQRQVTALNKAYNDYGEQMYAALEQTRLAALEENKTALKAEWGAKHDANIAIANRTAAHFWGQHWDEASKLTLADGSLVFDHPAMARALAAIGEATLTEDGVLPGEKDGGGFGDASAKAQIDRIRADAGTDPKHPYNDPRHPEHGAMHQRMARLYAQAYPGTTGPQ